MQTTDIISGMSPGKSFSLSSTLYYKLNVKLMIQGKTRQKLKHAAVCIEREMEGLITVVLVTVTSSS